jgi:RNA polymerase sigma-70 factor (ECF subfamily)
MSQGTEHADDQALAARLARGDEDAFELLVERHHAAMIRFARSWVGSTAIAEEVTQEAWLAVLAGVAAYEGRASLRTWMFRIVVRIARARAEREGRSIPLSELDPYEPAVPADRFAADDHPRWPGHWSTAPSSWDEVPEAKLLSAETRMVIERAIEDLPPNQRQVITLRDVEGWDSEEVCALLGLGEGNQRVLLHRARAKVRLALARHLGTEP